MVASSESHSWPFWRRLVIAGAAILAVFALGGFFVAPPLVKARLLRELSARLGRQVTIGAVSVNPFELSVTIRDLAIQDKDGAPFASWDKGYINYRFTSLLSRDYVFDDVSFERPFARLVIEKDGALNVDDLVRIFRASPTIPPGRTPPVWRFERFHLEEARVRVTDRTREPAFETTIGPLRLDLDRFATSRDTENPYVFNGSTDSGETFAWKGRFQTDPLTSSGEFKLGSVKVSKYRPYYEQGRPFRVRDGTLTLSSKYDLTWTADRKVLTLSGANLTLEDAKIGRPGSEAPDVEAGTISIENGDIDVLRRSARIDRVSLDGGHVLIRHDRDHKVNLYELIRPFVEAPSPGAPVPATASGAPAEAPAWSIGTLSITRLAVDAEDLAPVRPFRVAARDVAFTLTGIDTKPGTRCPVNLTARFGDTGTIKVGGTFSTDFHDGDLDVAVDGVDVRPADVYVDPVASLRIASGNVSSKGHVTFEVPPHGELRFHYAGELTVKDLATVEADTADPLARWAALKVAPLDIQLNPMRIAIGEIAVGAPSLHLEMTADRSLNLTRVLRPKGDAGATSAREAPSAATAPASALPDIRIGTLRLQNGGATLVDRSVEPTVTTSLSRLTGTIQGISSAELSRATVDLAAQVEGVAPVTIRGQINPFAQKDFTELTIQAKGIDIVPFSPYSGKWLGYGLGKGKLAADLQYKISERRFKSENLFTIEQFQLGEKTESPDAVRLPVKLAVAVLRDKNGNVVLDVPAEGNLDDPEFRWGHVIVRAVVNVLTKVVTSPFRLLAGAFGGKDQNVEYQDFAPGAALLADTERGKLDVVARSLVERPDLSLEIQGDADAVADTAALKRAGLDRRVRTQKWKSVSASNPALASPDAVTVDAGEYARWLRETFDAAFPPPPPPPPPKPVKGAAPAPPPQATAPTIDEMEAKLLNAVTVSADDLAQLAEARGRAVRDYLAGPGAVPAERLFLAARAAKEGRAPAARVWLELK